MPDTVASAAKPSTAHLMGTPLSQLLAELRVDVEESSITEPGFTGTAIVAAGEVIIWLPPGRTKAVRDLMTRHLIGLAFRVDGMPPLPEPYRTTEFTQITDDVNHAIREVQA